MSRVFAVLLTAFTAVVCQAEIVDPLLLDLLQRHAATLRSYDHPNGLNSIILEGTHEKINASTSVVKVSKERPSKIRFETLQDNGIEVTIAFNGQLGVSWGRVDDGKQVAFIDPKEGDINWLAIEGDFDGHLIRALKGDKTVELTRLGKFALPDTELQLECILATDSSDLKFRYYLHPSKFYIMRKQVIPSNGNTVMEIRYSRHRLVDGLLIAHRTELYADGVLTNIETYEKIRINTEIYDFLFARPKF
ncbi:MAG: hypothetical protein VXX82_01050 [Verrucomicrobiota bacterium]|nr:hypothetical protein [Verrucomicrobiota bacterium]